MKVKNITPDLMKAGKWYIVKPTNGVYHKNGVLHFCEEDAPRRLMGRLKFDFIYEFPAKYELKFFILKPENMDEWPRWTKVMDKYNGTIHPITTKDINTIEDDEELGGNRYIEIEGFGFSPNWFTPTEIPDFSEDKYKFMFVPTEVTLPKKSLTLSESLVTSKLSEQIDTLKKHNRSTADFIVFKEDGDFNEYYGEACHSSLSNNRNIGSKYVLSSIRCQVDVTEDSLKSYYYYLTNESPMKGAFIVKNIEWICHNKQFICTSKVPSNLLAAALIATRQAWEYPNTVNSFYKLVSAGVDSHLAYLLCNSCGGVKDGGMCFTRYTSNHSAIDADHMSDKDVLNFIKTGKPLFALGNYTKQVSYRRVFDLYASGDKSTLLTKLVAACRGEYGKAKYITIEETVDVIQSWCDEFYS